MSVPHSPLASAKTGDSAYVSACPVGCEAPLSATGIVLPEGPLLRCPDCGQLVSQITAARYWETMKQFDHPDYNQPGAPSQQERGSRVARRRLNAIAALLGRWPQDVRLIDVGCSRGHFVRAAADLGFQAEGVEPAPHIAAIARASGLNVYSGLLEEQRFPERSFDAVTMFEVIEHLREPRTLLAECCRILRPGGILLLSTGNTASWTVAAMGARWDYFDITRAGGHISFFNPQSLQRLAAGCGFAVVRIQTARMKFHERGEVPAWRYIPGKIAAELLNYPARLLGKGHDLHAYLRRPQRAGTTS